MRQLKIKTLGMISVWVTTVMDYLSDISAYDFIRKTVKVTLLGAISITAIVTLYLACIVACCIA